MRILTFDIEEWFHILDHPPVKHPSQWENLQPRIKANVERILSLLEKHNLQATFFILGWIADKYPEVVRAIIEQGHEIGLHSYSHQLIYEQKPEEFRTDLRKSLSILNQFTNKPVTKYRAPGFSVTPKSLWALKILMEEGITTDASVFPAMRQHGGCRIFPGNEPFLIKHGNSTLKEFPVNTINFLTLKMVFSGGGYFRAIPYKFIKYLTNRSDYVMTYFHPRDFDISQPMLSSLPLHRKVLSYYGIRNAERKLDKWLSNYSFINLEAADKATKWQQKKIIEIDKLLDEH